MAASKNDKLSYSLLSEYISLYYNKYNKSPILNKYKEKWAMQSLIDDFGIDEVRLTLIYYFKLSKDMHPLSWFFNSFSTIHATRLAAEKDNEIREQARKYTEKLRAEYLNGLS